MTTIPYPVQRQDIVSDLPLRYKGAIMTNPTAFRNLLARWRSLLLGKLDIWEQRN